MSEENEQPKQMEQLSETPTMPTLPRVEAVRPIESDRAPRSMITAVLGSGSVLFLVLTTLLLLVAHGRGSFSQALHAPTRTIDDVPTSITTVVPTSITTAVPTQTFIATATSVSVAASTTSVPSTPQPTKTATGSPSSPTPVPGPTIATSFISINGFMNIGPALTQTSDGNLWFSALSSNNVNAIVRMTPQGATTAFWLPQGVTRNIYTLTRGPDDNIWFYEDNALNFGSPAPTNWTFTQYIARMTKQGVITEYPLPPQGTDSITFSGRLIVGSDDEIWFCLKEYMTYKLIKISMQGSFTFYTMPAGGSGYNLVVGPDGAIWAHESNTPSMVRVTTDGQVSEWPIQANGQKLYNAFNLTTGADGTIWMTDFASNIGPYTLKGNVKFYPLTNFNLETNYISGQFMTLGKDGQIWFCGQLTLYKKNGITYYTEDIGRMLANGLYTLYEMPLISSNPNVGLEMDSLFAGNDGNLWITDFRDKMIVRVSY